MNLEKDFAILFAINDVYYEFQKAMAEVDIVLDAVEATSREFYPPKPGTLGLPTIMEEGGIIWHEHPHVGKGWIKFQKSLQRFREKTYDELLAIYLDFKTEVWKE